MNEQQDLDSKFRQKVAERIDTEVLTGMSCFSPWQSQFETNLYSEEKLADFYQ